MLRVLAAPCLSSNVGRVPSMKTKLVMVAIGVAAGLFGFWTGSNRSRHKWQQIREWEFQSQNHIANRTRASIAVSALSRLAEGKQLEARDALEMQLDLGISGMLFYFSNYSRTGTDSIDDWVVGHALSYRSQHPWTNSLRPDLTETVRRAFKKAD